MKLILIAYLIDCDKIRHFTKAKNKPFDWAVVSWRFHANHATRDNKAETLRLKRSKNSSEMSSYQSSEAPFDRRSQNDGLITRAWIKEVLVASMLGLRLVKNALKRGRHSHFPYKRICKAKTDTYKKVRAEAKPGLSVMRDFFQQTLMAVE